MVPSIKCKLAMVSVFPLLQLLWRLRQGNDLNPEGETNLGDFVSPEGAYNKQECGRWQPSEDVVPSRRSLVFTSCEVGLLGVGCGVCA